MSLPDPVNARRPAHTWGKDDRTFLAVLDRFYSMSRSDQQRIFNAVYTKKLALEGYAADTYRGLASQINDLKKRGSGSEHWNTVIQMPLGQALNTFQVQRRGIERAARKLNIGIHPRLVVTIAARDILSRLSPSKRTRFLIQDAYIYIYTHKCVSQDSHEIAIRTSTPKKPGQIFVAVEVPLKRQIKRAIANTLSNRMSPLYEEDIENILCNVRPPPRLRIYENYEGYHAPGQPRLLFRAFDPSHYFRARRFLDARKKIQDPPSYGSTLFRNAVEPHLSVDKTYKSPVISLTESASYTARTVDSDMTPVRSFAIFDYHEIEEDTERFGIQCKPRLVPVICKDYGLNLQGCYTGRGEVSLVSCAVTVAS